LLTISFCTSKEYCHFAAEDRPRAADYATKLRLACRAPKVPLCQRDSFASPKPSNTKIQRMGSYRLEERAEFCQPLILSVVKSPPSWVRILLHQTGIKLPWPVAVNLHLRQVEPTRPDASDNAHCLLLEIPRPDVHPTRSTGIAVGAHHLLVDR
jgi:hypothetical protein